MTYPNHYLLQFGGPRGTAGDEIWTCGIRLVPVPVDAMYETDAVRDYLNDVCLPALEAWFGRSESFIHSTAKLDFAKLNRINVQGEYADPVSITEFISPLAGGANVQDSAAAVPQASCVLTWETDDVSRGLASRGRIYSPAPAVKPDVLTGLFPTSNAQMMAESAAQLIGDLRGGGSAGAMTPNIVSDGGEAGIGIAHRIDTVSVDNRVDIVRKRANALTPVRIKVPV